MKLWLRRPNSVRIVRNIAKCNAPKVLTDSLLKKTSGVDPRQKSVFRKLAVQCAGSVTLVGARRIVVVKTIESSWRKRENVSAEFSLNGHHRSGRNETIQMFAGWRKGGFYTENKIAGRLNCISG